MIMTHAIPNPIFVLHHGRADQREILCAMSVMTIEPTAVIERLIKRYGPGWRAAHWVNVCGGVRTVQANPHFNTRGQLVYLFERIDQNPIFIHA